MSVYKETWNNRIVIQWGIEPAHMDQCPFLSFRDRTYFGICGRWIIAVSPVNLEVLFTYRLTLWTLGGVPVKKPPCMCKRVFMSNWMNLEHFRPVQWNVFVPPPTKFRQNCPPKRVLATMLISWQKCENRVQIVRMWTMNNYKGPALRRHIWVKF